MAVALQRPPAASNSVRGCGGHDLDMIYEEEPSMESLCEAATTDGIGMCTNLEAAEAAAAASILKRSRSLPQDEFLYLTQKLKELELQRTDSVLSGQSSR